MSKLYQNETIPKSIQSTVQKIKGTPTLKIPSFNMELADPDSKKYLGNWEKISKDYQGALAIDLIKDSLKKGEIEESDARSLVAITPPRSGDTDEQIKNLSNLNIKDSKGNKLVPILTSGRSILYGNQAIKDCLSQCFRKDEFEAGTYGSTIMSSCYEGKTFIGTDKNPLTMRVTNCEGTPEQTKQAQSLCMGDGHGKIKLSAIDNKRLTGDKRKPIKVGDTIQFRMMLKESGTHLIDSEQGTRVPTGDDPDKPLPFILKGTFEVVADNGMEEDLIVDKSQMKGYDKRKKYQDAQTGETKSQIDAFLPNGTYQLKGKQPAATIGIRALSNSIQEYNNSYQSHQGNSDQTIAKTAEAAAKEAEFIMAKADTPQAVMMMLADITQQEKKHQDATANEAIASDKTEEDQPRKTSTEKIAEVDKRGILGQSAPIRNSYVQTRRKAMLRLAMKGSNSSKAGIAVPNYNLKPDEHYIPGLKRTKELHQLTQKVTSLKKLDQKGQLSQNQKDVLKDLEGEKDQLSKVVSKRYPIANATTGRQQRIEIGTRYKDLQQQQNAGIKLTEEERKDLQRYDKIIKQHGHRKGAVITNPKGVEHSQTDFDGDAIAFEPNDEKEEFSLQMADVMNYADEEETHKLTNFRPPIKRKKIPYKEAHKKELKGKTLDAQKESVFLRQTKDEIGIIATDQAHIKTAKPLSQKEKKLVEAARESNDSSAIETAYYSCLRKQALLQAINAEAEWEKDMEETKASIKKMGERGEMSQEKQTEVLEKAAENCNKRWHDAQDSLLKSLEKFQSWEFDEEHPDGEITVKQLEDKVKDLENTFSDTQHNLLQNIGDMLQIEVDRPKSARNSDIIYPRTKEAIQDWKALDFSWKLLQHKDDERLYDTVKAPEDNTRLNPMGETVNHQWEQRRERSLRTHQFSFIFPKEPENCGVVEWAEWQEKANELKEEQNALVNDTLKNHQNSKLRKDKIGQIYDYLKQKTDKLVEEGTDNLEGSDREAAINRNRKLLAHALWKKETTKPSGNVKRAVKNAAVEMSQKCKTQSDYDESYLPSHSLDHQEAYIIKTPLYREAQENGQTVVKNNAEEIKKQIEDRGIKNFEAVIDDTAPTANFALLDPEEKNAKQLIEALEKEKEQNPKYQSIDPHPTPIAFEDANGNTQEIRELLAPEEMPWLEDYETKAKGRNMLAITLFADEVAEQVQSLNFSELPTKAIGMKNGEYAEELSFLEDSRAMDEDKKEQFKRFVGGYADENGQIEFKVKAFENADKPSLKDTPAIYLNEKILGKFPEDAPSLPINTKFKGKLKLGEKKDGSIGKSFKLEIDNDSIELIKDPAKNIEEMKQTRREYRKQPNKYITDLIEKCHELEGEITEGQTASKWKNLPPKPKVQSTENSTTDNSGKDLKEEKRQKLRQRAKEAKKGMLRDRLKEAKKGMLQERVKEAAHSKEAVETPNQQDKNLAKTSKAINGLLKVLCKTDMLKPGENKPFGGKLTIERNERGDKAALRVGQDGKYAMSYDLEKERPITQLQTRDLERVQNALAEFQESSQVFKEATAKLRSQKKTSPKVEAKQI